MSGDRIAAEVERLAADLRVHSDVERAALLPVLQRLASALVRVEDHVERMRSRIAVLERVSFQDALVPIPNRRAFITELRRSLAVVRRHETDLIVAYLDINDMKQINDGFGHQAGDAALLHVGAVLGRRIRSSDFVARLGGDEFGILMPACTGEEAILRVHELVDEIRSKPLLLDGKPIDTQGAPLRVTIAFGVSACTAEDTPESALARADASMYVNKNERDVA